MSEGNTGHLVRDPDLEMRIESCITCQRMIAKDGQPCARHGGPSRGTSWKQRSRDRKGLMMVGAVVTILETVAGKPTKPERSRDRGKG